MSVLTSAAQAVVDELNEDPETNFGLNFTAERSYADWDLPLEDLDELHVDVVPHPQSKTELSVSDTLSYEVRSTILVRKRFGTDFQDNSGRTIVDEVDTLVGVVEAIAEYFVKLVMTNDTDAIWQAVELPDHYVRDHLREHRQFTGTVRLTHRIDKVLA